MKKFLLFIILITACSSSVTRPTENVIENLANRATDWWKTPSMNDSRVQGTIYMGIITAAFGSLAVYKGTKALFGAGQTPQINAQDSTIIQAIKSFGRLIKSAGIRAGGACFSATGLGLIAAPQEVIKEIDKFIDAVKKHNNNQ